MSPEIQELLKPIYLQIRQIVREEVEEALLNKEDLLLPEELAHKLKVSIRTLYAYRQRGLPHIKVSSRTYYRWSDVIQFLKSESIILKPHPFDNTQRSP